MTQKVIAILDQSVVIEVIHIPPNELGEGIDISGVDPRPDVGWTYDGETFSPPA